MSTLFVGGTRSGKSRLAEHFIECNAKHPLYIATALIEDEETKTRVKAHRARRDSMWQCIEAAYFLPEHIQDCNADAILFDCLSMWLNNLMARGDSDAEILCHTKVLAHWIEKNTCVMAIVSSEIGLGIVPMSALARRYRDLHGEINQIIAKSCKNVILVSCGLPLKLKGEIPKELIN